MKTILFCGCTESEKNIIPPLTKKMESVHFGREKLSFSKTLETPELLIGEFDSVPLACSGKGIAIFGSKLKKNSELRIGFPWISVLESDNLAATRALIGTGAVAITCGTSSKDTLSLASISDNQAVVSLQRSLRTLSGMVIEPADFTIRLTGHYNVFSILAYCAILLLLEKTQDGDLLL